MVSLKRSDMRIFDDAFAMHSGDVLDFSDRTMAEFFEDEFRIEIYQQKYAFNGTSKAKHLRAFIENFLWSPVSFAAHRIGLALVVILLLLTAILAFIVTSWRRDRLVPWLFAPYAAWVGFALLLNGAISALN